MGETKEACKELEKNKEVLKGHDINPEPLIKELHRESNILFHDIKKEENK